MAVARAPRSRYSRHMAKAEDALIENLNAFVAFARKRVGDPELAADLVQDSEFKVFSGPANAEGGRVAYARFVHTFYEIVPPGTQTAKPLPPRRPEEGSAAGGGANHRGRRAGGAGRETGRAVVLDRARPFLRRALRAVPRQRQRGSGVCSRVRPGAR